MLRLTIIESPPGEMPEGETLVVGPAGATVGRSAENTWVLTDSESKLSRSHCEILCENGKYIVVDTSANGTFLNESAQPIGRGQKAPLESDSTIRLGDYLLRVSLEAPANVSAPPIGSRPDFLRTEDPPPAPEEIIDLPSLPLDPVAPEPGSAAFLDIKPEPLQDNPFSSPAGAGSAAQSDVYAAPTPFGSPRSPAPGPAFPIDTGPQPVQESPQELGAGPGYNPAPPLANPAIPESPQAPPPSTDVIPDDWYLDPGEESAPAPLPDPGPATPPSPLQPPAAAPPPAGGRPRRAQPVIREPLGTPKERTPEQPEVVERLRQALSGALGPHADLLSASDLVQVVEEMAGMIALSVPELMGALASRSQFKDHLRLNQTMVRARDNNPLKFCQSTEEALEHMLLNDHPGLLHGRLALQEAFRELAAHQTALVAALQPSLRETLEQLSPHSVEAIAGSENTAAFALPKGKGKLWDTYLEMYKKLAESERGTLEEKFMRSLGKHYERSLTALK